MGEVMWSGEMNPLAQPDDPSEDWPGSGRGRHGTPRHATATARGGAVGGEGDEGHAHLRCTKCGRLHDVDADLSGLVLPVKQRRGFPVEGAEAIFSRTLPMCRRRPAVRAAARGHRKDDDMPVALIDRMAI